MTIRGTDFGKLMKMNIKPTEYVVDGLIPVGLTLLAGKPKYGKSWTAYDMALSVSIGRDFLGSPTTQGKVLLMALEDNTGRSKLRGSKLLGEDTYEGGLTIVNIGARITPETALDDIEEWVEENPGTKLVVIDTVKHLRPMKGKDGYDTDYAFLYKFSELAHKLKVAIVAVFHTVKGGRADPMDEVQGTTGITAACDNIIVLRREARDSNEATFWIMGRDGIDETMAVKQNMVSGRWEYVGPADVTTSHNKQHLSVMRQGVMDILGKSTEPMTAGQVAGLLGESVNKVRVYMHRMVDDGQLKKVARGLFVASVIEVESVKSAPRKGVRKSSKTESILKAVRERESTNETDAPRTERRSVKKPSRPSETVVACASKPRPRIGLPVPSTADEVSTMLKKLKQASVRRSRNEDS